MLLKKELIAAKFRSTFNQRKLVLPNLGLNVNNIKDEKKFPKENNNLELIDNYLLDNDLQEPSAEIVMAAEIIDNYLLDKRFMRELEDEEYDAA